MRLVCSLFLLQLLLEAEAFTPTSRSAAFGVSTSSFTTASSGLQFPSWFHSEEQSSALYAKKKQKGPGVSIDLDAFDDDEPLSLKDKKQAEKSAKKKDAKAAALEALDTFDFDDDEPMSLKDQKQAEKLKMKEQKQQEAAAAAATTADDEPKMSASMKKMLAMDAADEARQASEPSSDFADSSQPKLSKKELKAVKKKEEKEAAKNEAKSAKKAAQMDGEGDEAAAPAEDGAVVADGDAAPATPVEKQRLTLEEKIRKNRPPPRIRVMESAQPGFSNLRLEGVGITFRDQEVLKDVTWGVQTGDRIGLVGANGAGKTTQLRILAGELEPTIGDVVKSSKDLRVAMLRQEFVDELVKTRTLKEEFMAVFVEENAILKELRDSEKELETIGTEDSDRMQVILDRMQDLQNKAENKGVYALEARVKKVLDLMGFTDDEGDDLVASFSGGWKMRIGLGKVLLQDPNILLLDEPTNHLDLESVEWLEEFLRQQNIPMIIVSHDREFLDQVCTKIVDAEGGICTEYDGNYSRFMELKKSRLDAWNAAFNAQEKKIKEERMWISKFKVKQPQAVKQRIAKLEKFKKSEDYVQKPPFIGKPFKFRFPDAPRLSPEVAEIRKLSHAYRNGETENKLFKEVDLFVEKGDRIAVVGPNGSGKSTLLRLMLDREKADEGEAKIVGQNVLANYFEQNQADALDLDKTVIQTVQGASIDQSYNELRALLGQFIFKGDAVEKKVRFLSGGEKARLSLCCMMLRPANLLILDEPTNHLDIPAKEMLEEALQYFSGSVMVISHDRYFISKVATSIVAIEEKKLVKYQGDYKFYMDTSNKMKEKIEARYVKGVSRIESAPVVDLEALQKPKANFGGAKTAGLVTRKDKGVKNAKRNQAK
jgi:ATP-binding cassette subfamily F protein 3